MDFHKALGYGVLTNTGDSFVRVKGGAGESAFSSAPVPTSTDFSKNATPGSPSDIDWENGGVVFAGTTNFTETINVQDLSSNVPGTALGPDSQYRLTLREFPSVPEIDPGSAGGALTLLGGIISILTGRRRRA